MRIMTEKQRRALKAARTDRPACTCGRPWQARRPGAGGGWRSHTPDCPRYTEAEFGRRNNPNGNPKRRKQ